MALSLLSSCYPANRVPWHDGEEEEAQRPHQVASATAQARRGLGGRNRAAGGKKLPEHVRKKKRKKKK
jgi:hypothetical protein